MKKLCFLFVFFFISNSAVKSQQVAISTNQLLFSATNELNVDSQLIYLKSNFDTLNITSITFFDIYDFQAFSVINSSNLQILPNDSIAIWVRFQPEQNIFYNSEMHIELESGASIAIDVRGQGVFSKNYYVASQNRVEQDLKNTLKGIIGLGYSNLGYNSARDYMYGTLDNQNGQVECVYTGRKATFNSRQGANQNNFNTEHVFPQGFFNSIDPEKSDLFHLRPTDQAANSARGNLPFGLVTGTANWSEGGSKRNSQVFEPRDESKGQIARGMLYFVLRYQNWASFLSQMNQEAVLRDWHYNQLPDAKEISRNNGIFSVQNNRNPFIDYPQFLKRIHSIGQNSVAPSINSFYTGSTNIDVDKMVYLESDSNIVEFAIVNTGNTILNLTDFQVNSTKGLLTDLNSTVNSIDVGESIKLRFLMDIDANFEIDADFSLKISGQEVVYQISGSPKKISTLPPGFDNELIDEKRFVLYPNPSFGRLRIDSQEKVDKVSIYDSNGKWIEDILFSSIGSFDFELPENKGIYFIQVFRNDTIQFCKVLRL